MWDVPLFAITPLARLVLNFIPVEECVCWVESASAIEQNELFHWIKDDRLWNTRTVLAIARNDNVHLLCQNQRWMTSFIGQWHLFFEYSGPDCVNEYIARVTVTKAYWDLCVSVEDISERNFDIVFWTIPFDDYQRYFLLAGAIRAASRNPRRRKWFVMYLKTHFPKISIHRLRQLTHIHC